MALYRVKFYTGNYVDRQRAANTDGAICYVEQHFNASANPDANYSLVVVADNSSSTSREWGRWYAREVARRFGIRDNGILVGGYMGRGNGNLKYTQMPAILLEPFFISHPQGAAWAESRQDELAEILAQSIRTFFPGGGRVAFSVGHKGRPARPNDLGARSVNGEWEADLAEPVMKKAALLLEAVPETHAEEEDDAPIPAPEVSPWARDAHAWVVAQGISDGSRPHEQVTREELWTMLYRAVGPSQ